MALGRQRLHVRGELFGDGKKPPDVKVCVFLMGFNLIHLGFKFRIQMGLKLLLTAFQLESGLDFILATDPS